MNKIVLVAEGKFDCEKLIKSLRRMIIDPGKESISVINIRDDEYKEKDGTIKIQSFFMGQIVPKDDRNSNIYITFEDENGMQIKEYYISGFLDDESVLNSTIIEDLISSEQDRTIIRNNPSLLLKYLLDMGEENIGRTLNDYGINGVYSVLNDSAWVENKPDFYFGTTGSLIGYTDTMPKYPSEDHTVSYYTNSREVLEYLGVDYRPFIKLEKKSRYYPDGFSMFSGIFLSHVEKDRMNKEGFPIGCEEQANKAYISVLNSTYRLKKKNK